MAMRNPPKDKTGRKKKFHPYRKGAPSGALGSTPKGKKFQEPRRGSGNKPNRDYMPMKNGGCVMKGRGGSFKGIS